MVKVSKEYTILPMYCTTEAEIRNTILRRLGFSTINIKEFVIGKGISHMFGGNPKIVGWNLSIHAKKILDLTQILNTFSNKDLTLSIDMFKVDESGELEHYKAYIP